jgi:hypothetical protein
LERLSQLSGARKIHILTDAVYLLVLEARRQTAQARIAEDFEQDRAEIFGRTFASLLATWLKAIGALINSLAAYPALV